jgi:adenylate cyclase
MGPDRTATRIGAGGAVVPSSLVRAITLTRVVHCKAARDAVWRHATDSPRLNRSAGNTTRTVTELETDGLERFELRCRIGGFRVSYVEHPWAFAEGEFCSWYRRLLEGPARSMTMRYDFADVPGDLGCDVSIRFDVTPRRWFMRPLIWLASRRTVGAIARYIASVDEPDHDRPVVGFPVDEGALQAARARIGPKHAPELVARLVEYVRDADDLALSPMRPFALAKAWSEDRTAVLRLCLEAVPAGLLELRWGLLCPSCNTTSQTLPSLRDLESKGHCHACDLRFDTDLDRAVEAQFLPHPSIRHVDSRPFCISGPALVPHVLAQTALEKGASGTLVAPHKACRVRLFVRGGATAAVDVVESGAPTARAEIHADDVSPAQLSIAPHGTLTVVNEAGAARHAKLERTEFLSDAATAHHVATMPEFRPLFGAEALRPGLALKIAHVAILFSDLCGSTALYSRIGDAAAFGVVTDSFRFGTEIVERHGGSVVKTMGDAVMAAFTSSGDAMAAGLEMLERWPELVKRQPAAAALDLKVGVNAGPCTIVTANKAIDYFGQTVNGAARLLHLAGAREAVVAEALVDSVPEGAKVDVVERIAARVKGIDEPLRVARLRVR